MATLRILLIIIFLIAALAVTIIVLLQEGKSAGLGSIGGSQAGGNSYWEKNKKYSLEGKFEKWTKITAAVFVLAAFLIMLIPNNSGSSTNNATSNTTTNSTTDTTTAGEGTNGTVNSVGGSSEEGVTVAPADGEAATDAPAATEEAPAASPEASASN